MSRRSIALPVPAWPRRALAVPALAAVLVALSPLRHGTAAGLLTLVAKDDSYSVRHDRTLTIVAPGVLANDVGIGGGSTAVLNAGPTHAAQFGLQADGAVSYRAVARFVGTDTFTYHAHDLLDSTLATVTITVTNAAPVANSDSYTAMTGVTLSVPAPGVLANDTDADGDALSAQLVDGGGNGSLDLNADGSFTFKSGGSFAGDRTFTYRVGDGLAWSAATTVTISVSPTATPEPTPAPTPAPTPTPPVIPLPTLAPLPTAVPLPSQLPLPTLVLPGSTSRPTSEPTPAAAPGQSPAAPTPGAAVLPPPGVGGPADGGALPPGPNGARGANGLEVDGVVPFDALDGLGLPGLGGFDWAVPSLVLSVPGLLLILALLAQGGVGLFSIPFVRRWLGTFGLRRGRTGEARTG
ncbi:MAG TPA: Ig-like domain-containing protein [Patescibacteria group bacterium]|nr:Ig-like domain-containing protein [Patescibacteria group bacterium]